jgi:hypothetical protein
MFNVPQIMDNVENNYNSVNHALLEMVSRYSFETPPTLRTVVLVS